MDLETVEKRYSTVDELTCSLDEANILLIYKEFNKCLKLCTEQLIKVRRHPDNNSCEELKEALCVLTIQAYAELNLWQEVLPFVTNIYKALEDVPAKVIQLCVLLHASVKDYPTCAALANIWLRNPRNGGPELQDTYLEMIDIYVGHVLIPADRWEEMQSFLDGCPGLHLDRRDHCQKVIKALRHQVDQLKVEEIEVAEDDPVTDQTDKKSTYSEKSNQSHSSKALSESSRFAAYVHRVSQWLSKSVPVVTMYIIKHFTIIALLVYILISQADIDVLSWKTLGKLWMLVGSLWKRMFAPFHQAKT